MVAESYDNVYEAALKEFAPLIDSEDREDLRVLVGSDDAGRFLEFRCPTSGSVAEIRPGLPVEFMGFRTIVSYYS